MREVWKGMVIGALVGAFVGLILESLRTMSRGAKKVAHEASAQAPNVAASAADFASGVAQKVRDSDLPERAADAAKVMGEQLKDVADAGRTTAKDRLP